MMRHKKEIPITIRTPFGLEAILAEELTKLGAKNIQPMGRAVKLVGDMRLVFKCNLALRTANRVLLPLASFRVQSEQDLYNHIKKLEWESMIPTDGTIAVRTTLIQSRFRNSHFLSLKAKDAIVDRMRTKTGARPSVDLDNPDLPIDLQIFKDSCTLSLDTSGASLHKRGYRNEARSAPLNEVLAAGMILMTGWRGDRLFVDPMCGSGSLLIEAALIAKNQAPGLMRKRFAIQSWPEFDTRLWNSVVDELKSAEKNIECELLGFDSSPVAIRLTQDNLQRAGFLDHVKLDTLPLDQQNVPDGGGIVVMNPPYGERLKKDDIDNFYKMIGDCLKNRYTGYDAWMISSNFSALKKVGLKASKKIVLFNGALECSYRHYELYKGSRDTEEPPQNTKPVV